MPTKSVPEKLLIRGSVKALFVNAPKDYWAVIDSIPLGVTVVKDLKKGPVDVIQLFVSSKSELEEELGRLKSVLGPKGMLWVTYPKGSSSVKSDLNRMLLENTRRQLDWRL